MAQQHPHSQGGGFLPEHADDLLAAVMRNTADGMAVVDLDGRIWRWNAAAEDIYGWTQQQLTGLVFGFVPEVHRAKVLAQMRQALSSACVSEMKIPAQRPDGSKLVLNAAIVPLGDADGHTSGALLIARDALEDQRFSRQRRDFSAMVARHLTGPVQAIRSHVRLLARPEMWLDETRRSEVLSALGESVEGLRRISERLALLARCESPGPAGTREPVDVSDVIRHIVADLPAGRVVIEFELGTEPVNADAAAVTASLRALLDRSYEEALDLPLLVSTRMEGDDLLVEVTDPSWPGTAERAGRGSAGAAEAEIAMAVANGVFSAQGGTVKTVREGFGSKISITLPTNRHLTQEAG